ncbi:MAG: exodeoxyribonuclease III [Sandaracinaceae bacterium]|nr:exodeoxyribonuclease III [Sandaracinaceae bacterium]
MIVVSWNVNGIRSIAQKGFRDWLEESGATIVGVQETRADAHAVPIEVRHPPGWHTCFTAAERKGYSGVALYSRLPFDDVDSSVGVKSIDAEGRVQIARIGALVIANVYFPNGSGKDRDNSRVPYKLRFYRRLYRVLEPLKSSGAPVIVMGDFNTAPQPIDLARPKQNEKTSGFLPEERKELARWLAGGWIDTYRVFETRGDRYTWWSQRYGVRERNIGWRIDLMLASPGAEPYLRSASIHAEVLGSDHCPISLELDGAVLEAGSGAGGLDGVLDGGRASK